MSGDKKLTKTVIFPERDDFDFGCKIGNYYVFGFNENGHSVGTHYYHENELSKKWLSDLMKKQAQRPQLSLF